MDPKKVKEPVPADITEIIEAAVVSERVSEGGQVDFGVSDEPTLVGQVLSGRYKVIEQLGSGAMGTVYKAEHVLMGQIHAIKVLHKHLTSDAHSLQRFQVEAKAASALRHDNLLTVTDYGITESNQPFIVMDYIAGKSLADVLSHNGPLSLADFVDTFSQVCEGLAHAHDKNVVHRDLKPSNIILTTAADGSKNARIVDFGIAKILPNHNGAAQHLTQTGEIFGSPLYMSPEQCRGGKVDCRSDIYSLGCVMFEALTGSVPVQEASAIETLFKHINGSVPPISQMYPKLAIPVELESIVSKALENYPEKRYQLVEEIASDLDQFRLQRKLPVVARTAAPKRPKSTSASSSLPNVNRFLAAMCIVLLLALGTVLAIHLTQPSTTLPPPVDVTLNQVPATTPSVPVGGDAEQATKDVEAAWTKLYDDGAESALVYATSALNIRQRIAPDSEELAESLNQVAYLTNLLSLDSYGEVIPAKREAAENIYKQAIKMASDNEPDAIYQGKPLYQRNLASLYMGSGRWKEAYALLEEVRHGLKKSVEEIDPREPIGFEFLGELARVTWGLEKYEEAAKIQVKLAVPTVKFADLKIAKTPDFAGAWQKIRVPGDVFFGMQLQQLPSGVISGRVVASNEAKERQDGDNDLAGSVKNSLGNVTWHTEWTSGTGDSVLIRMNNYLIWHISNSPKEDYYPDSCVLVQDASNSSLFTR